MQPAAQCCVGFCDLREFRCRLVHETTQEAKDEAEARRIAVSKFVHYLVDEGVEDEQIVVSLEDCGYPLMPSR